MKKTIRILKKGLEISLIIILLGTFLFTIISKFLLKKDLIKICGYGALIVITGSMEPTINIREMVVIKEQEDYNVLDIVTYRDLNDSLVTHRIVSRVGDIIVTRGDNNTISDTPININRIEGKVCYHSAVLGEIFLCWIKPILIIIIICLISSNIKNIILDRRKKNDEKD